MYLGTEFRYILIHIGSIRDNALRDMTLIVMIVACFVGTGSFLISYCNGYRQLNTVFDYFKKTLFLVLKKVSCKLDIREMCPWILWE